MLDEEFTENSDRLAIPVMAHNWLLNFFRTCQLNNYFVQHTLLDKALAEKILIG